MKTKVVRRVLAAAAAMAMACTLLAGCGGGNASGSTGGSAGGSGETQDVSLKVWCPQNQVDTGIMAQQQAAFAAAHPEYNITWTTEIVGEDVCQENVLRDVDPRRMYSCLPATRRSPW